MTNDEPKLKNMHHEIFAQEVAKNMGNYTQAYLIAYPDASTETAQGHAHNLAKRPEVASAIKYYKELFLKDLKITKEHVLMKVLRIQKKTENNEDYSNSLKACDMLAKMAGAYSPETQVNILVNNAQIEQIEDYLFKKNEP